MKQLGILDSAFINLEQVNTPQHIGGLGIYDPSTAPGGSVRFKQMLASFERRLTASPLFRTRLVEVPGGLDRPYWVKDADFDVEFHLRHIALPHPGDWRQLCIQVARLHSRPLDMSRPLWEAYIIEGLDNIPNLPKGSFAIYTKIHHSLVDGAGGANFMGVLHDIVPDPGPEDERESEPRLADAEPSMAELLGKASINRIKNSGSFVAGFARTTRDLGKVSLQMLREQIPKPDLDGAETAMNQPVGPHRVFDAAEFPLEGFRDIKNATGVKLNDVAMGVIGGALVRYLKAKGELPEGPLTASLPVNMRTRRGLSEEDNNQVGAVIASMHTNENDPLARLAAIHQSTRDAKEYGETNPMVDLMKLAGAFSPRVAKSVARFWARNNISQMIPMNVATIISNVAGPDFPLYCGGARMVDYYGLGVLTPGIGLFHMVFSYTGVVTLSVLANRNIMPDPEFYHDCLIKSYEELYAAASTMKKTDSTAKGKKAAKSKAKIESPKRKKPSSTKPVKASKKKAPAKASSKPSAKKKTAKKVAKARITPKKRPAAKAKAAPKAKAKMVKSRAKSKTPARPKIVNT